MMKYFGGAFAYGKLLDTIEVDAESPIAAARAILSLAQDNLTPELLEALNELWSSGDGAKRALFVIDPDGNHKAYGPDYDGSRSPYSVRLSYLEGTG